MVSAADHLRLSPLFNAGRYPVFADTDAEQIKGVARDSLRFWLPLEDRAFARMLAVGGQIQPAEHWLFTLNQVVAEPSQQISLDHWRELTEIGAPYIASPGWQKWIAWLSLVLLALAVIWKKGWWSLDKVWALIKGGIKVSSPILNWVLDRFGLQLVLMVGLLTLALSLYGGGLLGGENYFFGFATLALLFALRAGLLSLEPHFRRLFPATAERVYGGAGSLYFIGALVMLVAAVAVLCVRLEFISEQLAIVAYYCLVIGTVQAFWALHKGDKKTVEIANNE